MVAEMQIPEGRYSVGGKASKPCHRRGDLHGGGWHSPQELRQGHTGEDSLGVSCYRAQEP